MFGRIGTWWRRSRTEIGLYALDDRLLADMGVCRRHLGWHLRTGEVCQPERCRRPGDAVGTAAEGSARFTPWIS
ncbi:DUF1127 domain-containing protein [Aureimonas leprariae]|uniref:DUF1127 domain-containing protein n=1 Tax=Plantimonas leprariae TaxID=2615207 RepID=A0A7V7PNJ3_9HYPH|nr:DUF1127 domain-containing protein [Aureimonas leprariae]KAB0679335.1 DUF1127 domain-containing protein [Aureimonas leprariae]